MIILVCLIKSNVSLNFLGGYGEIGGNKIFLHDSKYKVKIIMDFGCCFQNFNNKYKKSQFPEILDNIFDSGAFPRTHIESFLNQR